MLKVNPTVTRIEKNVPPPEPPHNPCLNLKVGESFVVPNTTDNLHWTQVKCSHAHRKTRGTYIYRQQGSQIRVWRTA